jgi:acetyl-CoA C-acetyltransferase
LHLWFIGCKNWRKEEVMQDIVIVEAARTAIGNFMGAFGATPAHKLGEAVIRELLKRTGLSGADVSEVILGQVLTAAQGQNPARQASLNAGLPKEVPAWGINQVCGSGLRAVALGFQAISNGDSKIVIAGGQENMSLAPHAAQLRTGLKFGDANFTDTMIFDGLTDIFSLKHMGITAENVAKQFNISRATQDEFSANSQNKAEAAQKAGKFNDEIIPVTVKKGKEEISVTSDEFPRHGTTAEKLGALKPAFDKEGSVTAGNASGINDGAAAVVLMSADEAKARNLTPIARIAGWAHAGVDPSIMGTGPIPASQAVLKKVGWKAEDLDLIEANEAFAAQACAVNQQMGWDLTKVNVNGGAIALGHPIGASGCRILVTLLHEMKRRQARKGLATLCIGGGMGIAMCVER